MNTVFKKLSISIKIIILLGIISLFLALCILNVNNVENKKTDNSIEQNSKEYSYTIKNNKLYININEKTLHEVPIDLNKIIGYDAIKGEIKENLFQLSDIKLMFLYKSEDKIMMLSSDNGETWKTSEIHVNSDENASPMYVQFTSKDNVIAVMCYDVAMRRAMAKVLESNDLGETWELKKTGENGYIDINVESKITFLDNKLGYISDPENGGNSASLYMTDNGGETFSKVELPAQVLTSGNPNTSLNWSDVYDFYNIPKKVGDTLQITVSQGNDGDYLGGNLSAKYQSYDMGKTWIFVEEYVPNE